MRKLLLFLVSAALLFSCALNVDDYWEGDFFYVRNKGADMPVWVTGNTASNVFIVYIHGGPGDSSFSAHFRTPFIDIEQKYAMVYYDQRLAGCSMGEASAEDFTIDQFTEDCDKIVSTIKAKYHNPDIFLMGKSWGGALGTAYLLNSERQSKIRGWMELAGNHDDRLAEELSRQFVIDYGLGIVSHSNSSLQEKKEWDEILEWYSSHPVITPDITLQHASYVNKAHGYWPEGYKDTGEFFADGKLQLIETALFSRMGVSVFINNDFSVINFKMTGLTFVPEMHRITIPSMIIWGSQDGRLPLPMAQQAYEAIGTPEIDKSILVLPNSAHSPVRDDFDLFTSGVFDFIEKYKS